MISAAFYFHCSVNTPMRNARTPFRRAPALTFAAYRELVTKKQTPLRSINPASIIETSAQDRWPLLPPFSGGFVASIFFSRADCSPCKRTRIDVGRRALKVRQRPGVRFVRSCSRCPFHGSTGEFRRVGRIQLVIARMPGIVVMLTSPCMRWSSPGYRRCLEVSFINQNNIFNIGILSRIRYHPTKKQKRPYRLASRQGRRHGHGRIALFRMELTAQPTPLQTFFHCLDAGYRPSITGIQAPGHYPA